MGKHGESTGVRPVSNHTLQAEFTTKLPVYSPINREEHRQISISTPICFYHLPSTFPLFSSSQSFLTGYVMLFVTPWAVVDKISQQVFFTAYLGNERFQNTSEKGYTLMFIHLMRKTKLWLKGEMRAIMILMMGHFSLWVIAHPKPGVVPGSH